VFFSVFWLGLAENEEVARDGLAGKSTADVNEFAGGSLIASCFVVTGGSKWVVWFFVWVYMVF
jgi:hypothetical protein